MRKMKIPSITAAYVAWALLGVSAHGQDTAGFVWQTDQEVRQTGVMVNAYPDLSVEPLSGRILNSLSKNPTTTPSNTETIGRASQKTNDAAPAKKPSASGALTASGGESPAVHMASRLQRGSAFESPETASEPPAARQERVPVASEVPVPSGDPSSTADSQRGNAAQPVAATEERFTEGEGAACERSRRYDRSTYGHDSDDDASRCFALPSLESRNIRMRGWIDQGYTWNPDSPANRFNGPDTVNDRSNEYQMNQFYAFAERLTNTGGCGVDWGGRVDLLYGTDWRWVRSNGLEDTWNESSRFYGLAMPQLYADFAMDDWVFRFGHFYSDMGFESAMAPDNFFYSHTYTFQYGQPITYTGFEASFKINDQVTATGGLQRGWNQWEDNNDKVGFLGKIAWRSLDEKTGLTFGIVTGNEQVGFSSSRTVVSVLLDHRFTDRFRWAIQYDGGRESNVVAQAGADPRDAEWYSVTNYFFLDLNPCWTLGLRHEWFADLDGARIVENDIGGHTFQYAGAPGWWNELALGVNFKPNKTVTLRSEVRWDWIANADGATSTPFDDSTTKQQFLWGTDLIVHF
jgi:hypothetical protein